MYKLYSPVLNPRLPCLLLEFNEVLAEEQNGFRRGRSGEVHIFDLNSLIRNGLCEGKCIYASVIYFKAAFDVVDRNMMLYKIINLGVNVNYILQIKQIYNATKARVQAYGLVCNWKRVRPGDTLSSTLFLLIYK